MQVTSNLARPKEAVMPRAGRYSTAGYLSCDMKRIKFHFDTPASTIQFFKFFLMEIIPLVYADWLTD